MNNAGSCVTASLTFFPVSNGDMALIRLQNDQTILIDIKIRGAADDEDDNTPDVAKDLRSRLKRDAKGRLYVDAFLLSHPDADHISGLRNHFHLGPPDEWNAKEDKILIREMWSSPIVFRRANANHVLCDDAMAWAKEARRRVQCFRDSGSSTVEGDRILIMGEDADGKTDDIRGIVIKIDEIVSKCNRVDAGAFEARLLAPLPAADEAEEDELTKNGSSVVMNFSLAGGLLKDRCRFLTGGDAEVAVWKRLWKRHGVNHPDYLSYDVLETPHHCSWRTLSFDSWTDLGEKAKVDADARSALSQTRKGAVIVASCKPIKADDDNPPHERAKREYVDIVNRKEDRFFCTDEYWKDKGQALEFEIKENGVVRKIGAAATIAAPALGVSVTVAQPRQHG